MDSHEKQRTIKNEARFSGKALQTGARVELRCLPSQEGTGVVFRRVDIKGRPEVPVNPKYISSSKLRRSALKRGKAEVQTTEHFLAALWALGIDNILVEIDASELPAMDGSAAAFMAGLEKAGIQEQDARRRVLSVRRTHFVKGKNGSITVSPADKFSVSYRIDYPLRSIGRETMKFDLDREVFAREIAPARTFCMKKEAMMLLKIGLGKGADLENTLVMDDDGPMGTKMRFPNEPLRHKIMDLVGDLYMLGVPLQARVEAVRSGHTLNAALIRQLYGDYMVRTEERRENTSGMEGFLLKVLSIFRTMKKGEQDGK